MSNTMSTSATALLRKLDADLTAAEREREALNTYIKGLQAARDGIAKAVLGRASKPKQQAMQDGPSRTSVIQEILRSAEGKPVSLDAMLEELKKRGRPDQRKLVRSTVDYLQRKGDCKSTDKRGEWVATKELVAAA